MYGRLLQEGTKRTLTSAEVQLARAMCCRCGLGRLGVPAGTWGQQQAAMWLRVRHALPFDRSSASSRCCEVKDSSALKFSAEEKGSVWFELD